MWRIGKIHIENFKVFKEPFCIDLSENNNVNGKNLLIYGENGSGKSSIQWGLYTFFQSSLKTQDKNGAGKYFHSDKQDNLRNLFSQPNEYSGMTINFREDDSSIVRTYEISNIKTNTYSASDDFVRGSLQASDFLNYKFLQDIFNCKNSQQNDLTHLFVSEIFPFANFTRSFTNVKGIAKSSNIGEWWEAIHKDIDAIPRTKINNLNTLSLEYTIFKENVKTFNEELTYYLQEVSHRAQYILQHQFGLDINLRIVPRNDLTFNHHVSSRRYDAKVHDPVIIIDIDWNHSALASGMVNIARPHTFFNEAKLTCIALAIRLAVINVRMSSGSSYASILCLDDLLISLDMGCRLKVVDILMEYSSSFQMFIFTHDYALYNLFSNAIRRKHEKNLWVQKEIYVLDDELSTTGIPTSIVCDSESYFEKAKRYYGICDIPACANNLRKETEKILKELLPKKLMYAKVGEEYRLKNLSGLIKSLPHFYMMYNLPQIVTHMDWFRARILNPMSHDNHSTPIYKQELKLCIEELDRLKQLSPKHIIVTGEKILNQKFTMSIDNGAVSLSIEFVPEEEWDYIFNPADGKRYYKNIAITIQRSSDNTKIPTGPHHELKSTFSQMCIKLGFATGTEPNMGSVIKRKSDSVELKNITD